MPRSQTIDADRLFFVKVDAICRRPVVTCAPDLGVVDAARIMKRHNVPALVVVRDGNAAGLFALVNLHAAVAESEGALLDRSVQDHLARLVTVGRKDTVVEALLRIAREELAALGVVDEEGNVVGIVTAEDLVKVQSCTPLHLHHEIEHAESILQLSLLGRKVRDLVALALAVNSEVKSIVKLISGLNDALSRRLIWVLGNEEGIVLPAGAAYLVLGSEGRGEQTLRTDQDSAIVYEDGLSGEKLDEVRRFAERLVEALEEIGVPRCPGDTMASSPHWRHSLSEWKKLVRRWMTVPTPENVLNFGMFQDLRALHGDLSLGAALHDHIRASVQRNTYFFPNMAEHAVRFPSPFTIFGRIRVEPNGRHRGELDLKKAGLFAITAGTRVMALEVGIGAGNTWERLEQLGKRKLFSRGDLKTVEAALSYLTKLRLQHQLRETPADHQETAHIDPQTLTDDEREQLRQALNGVNTFLWIFRDHYNLDYRSI